MAAGKHTISIEQGATFNITLTLKDATDTVIDLTGHTFRGSVRKTVSDSVIQASMTFTKLDQVSLSTRGKVVVKIDAADTALIKCDKSTTFERKITKMAYDIESVDGSGNVFRWLEGTAEVSPEVTR